MIYLSGDVFSQRERGVMGMGTSLLLTQGGQYDPPASQ